MPHNWKPSLGATWGTDGRCAFRVWAPFASDKLELHLIGEQDRYVAMQKDEWGYYTSTVEGIVPGQLYRYRINGDREYADPASRYQPDGVFGPSQVSGSDFGWTDENWRGLPLRDYIIYELHVGVFTQEGTFSAMLARLDTLVELGVTAIEFMPLNQFSGARGWGYDGVFLFAVQHSYGTVESFKQLVDACHQRGLAVILDVVYNHFGPEGNYIGAFGPYTTDRYKTPWGEAVNVDGAYSDEVRAYFMENALYWLHECHVDALRLDAIHFIFDFVGRTFIEELANEVEQYREQTGRLVYLMAESDQNDPDLVRPQSMGGTSLDALWLDDFHHALHTLVTFESNWYYEDYGAFQQLVKALREGFVYDGQYSPARKRRHGAPSRDVPVDRFIVFFQNHDQIGNRMPNQRAIDILPFEAFKLSMGLVILSPYIPMLFMGDEYGERREFEFFMDYHNPDLIASVRDGRRQSFGMRLQDGVEPPDPQAEDTFLRSKLNWQLLEQPEGQTLFAFHKELIHLRKSIPALAVLERQQMDVHDDEEHRVIGLSRWSDNSHVYAAFNFSETYSPLVLPVPAGEWHIRFDSAAPRWGEHLQGEGDKFTHTPLISDGQLNLSITARSFILLERV